MKSFSRLVSCALVLAAVTMLTRAVAAAPPEDEIRRVFERFVAAQNAHNSQAVEELLLDSPQFLWITRGVPVWGRADAIKRFESLFAGAWRLEPDMREFKVVLRDSRVAQIFVPIVFTIGPSREAAQDTRFLMNQVLTKTDSGWRISSILPIPAAGAPK